MLTDSPGWRSPSPSLPNLCRTSQFQIEQENSGPLWAVSCTTGEAGFSITYSHLPPWDKLWPRTSLLTVLCCLGGGVMQGKVKLFLLSPSMCPILDLNFFQSMYLLIDLLQECARTSRLDFWTSTKAPFPLGNCQIRCSLGTRQ